MTNAVVVVGPAAVCGPGVVAVDTASVALEAIDDRLTVHADRVVAVRELWREVMHAALAGERGPAVLVVPSWWPRSRVELVEDATLMSCTYVSVQLRGRAAQSDESDLVELGVDCVVVHVAGERFVVPVGERAGQVTDAVLALLPATTSVIVDVPDAVPGVGSLATELVRRLRKRGVSVTALDDAGVRRAVCDVDRNRSTGRASGHGARHPPRRGPRAAVLAGGLAVLVALAGAALTPSGDALENRDVTWVVEGRVVVELPADWTVERVTSGPGSARVQASSPMDPAVAIHLTQARVRVEETLQDTAEALKAALAEQPLGRFADFDSRAHRAGRPAVTYREQRSATGVDWVVMLDRGVRIAVGCQHPVGRLESEPACERAVSTAHALP